MKTKLTFLLLFIIAFCNAQIVNIPDANFKAKLLAADTSNQLASSQTPAYTNWTVSSYNKIDVNNDGQIQITEAQSIKWLNINNNSNISDLTGIEAFTNLNFLSCSYNQITNLNISGLTNLQCLQCLGNRLTNLNVAVLTNLQKLDCSNNQLTNINIAGLINLDNLNCSYNQLPNLNVAGLNNLQYLICSNNQITNLNVSGLANLSAFVCQNNQLSNLNVSGLTNLQNLDCSGNQLPNLDVSGLNLNFLDCKSNQLPTLNVSGLTNLQNLDCSYNQLPTLNVSNLINLINLNFSDNQLTSFNASSLTNLQYLNCSRNYLTNLNVSGMTNLQNLDCSSNLLTNLNVLGLTNLGDLYCFFNQLPSLNVSGLTNLQDLDCSYNGLSSLDFSGLTNLQNLSCSYNQLSSLNVSGLPYLQSLYCRNNQLSNLNIKNGGTYLFTLEFNFNPNLQFICSNFSDVILVQQKINTYGMAATCQVNTYCSFVPGGTIYSISGNSLFDYNTNGCDAADINFTNLKLSITNATNTGTIIPKYISNYNISVQEGTYAITPQLENPNYFNVSPTSASVTFPTQTSPLTQNFCITPNGIHHDLEIIIIPVNPARPGFDATYKLIYKNKGNVTESGTVNVSYPDAILDYVSSSLPVTTQTYGNLIWNFTNLQPFETREITFTLNVNSPTETPAVNAGTQLNFTAIISSPNLDEEPSDSGFDFKQIVVNSFDPNDKTCLQGTTISQTNVGDYVHYMIRFENTGTFPAENVVIKDLIDLTKFDINSLIPMKGSHNFETRISDNNKVEFIFENINLPFDDANNDGYIVFKIKTKSTLVVGNTFSNSANIYFDYNFPIVTNNYTTTIQNNLGLSENELSKNITIYPNPVKNTLTFDTKETILKVEIYDISGRILSSNSVTENKIDVSQLKTGSYILKVITENGIMNSKIIKE